MTTRRPTLLAKVGLALIAWPAAVALVFRPSFWREVKKRAHERAIDDELRRRGAAPLFDVEPLKATTATNNSAAGDEQIIASLKAQLSSTGFSGNVGGFVHDSNMDSSTCGARMKSLSCIGPVGHAGNHVAYRGEEVLLWKPSNSYSFECSRDQING